MAEIRGFKAHLYSENLHNEMQDLISPPYDVIHEEGRQGLIQKNKFNSVQICLKAPNQTYQDMKNIFEKWKSEKVLEQHPRDALYLIEERFLLNDKEITRIGFIGLLKTSDFSEKKVLPHENTLSGPKKDRFELLENLRAEASQVFFCYDDPDQLIEGIYNDLKQTSPRVSIEDPSGVSRKLWVLDQPQILKKIKEHFSNKKLLIADGHHRYETALSFSKTHPEIESQYVQAYFTNRLSPNFEILAIHRICSLPENWTDETFLKALAKRFQVEALEKTESSLTEFVESHKNPERIGFLLVSKNLQKSFFVSRKKETENDAEIFSLQKEIFEPLFQWTSADIAKEKLSFEHDEKMFLERIKKTRNGIGFLLPPTDLDLVMKIVETGERMPQKSTFFYPKIASGLVIYELGSFEP